MEGNKNTQEQTGMEMLPEDRKIMGNFKQLDYPTEEDYQKMIANSGGSTNMGTAPAIPVQEFYQPPIIKPIPQSNTDLLGGIPEEGSRSNPRKSGIGTEKHFDVKPQPKVEKKSTELELITNLLENCKKSEYDIELKLKVRLPYKGFFDIFDEKFVNKNEDRIFNEIAKLINQDDVFKQLKAKIIEIYNNAV